MTTVSLKMARVSEDDMRHLWRLFRAAQRADWTTGRQEAKHINFTPDRDYDRELTREEIFFFRCAWRVCVDTGAFGRIMGGYDTLFLNFADPNKDYLDFKPSLFQKIQDSELVPVLIEAFKEALKNISTSETAIHFLRQKSEEERKRRNIAYASALNYSANVLEKELEND